MAVPIYSAHIDKYVCFRRDRQDGRQGCGVAVYVRRSLPCTHITTCNSFDVESVWLLCRYSRMLRLLSHILVGAIYYLPDGDKNSVISHILDCLDRCSHDHPY